MFDVFVALIFWFAQLFNPPPLASMTSGQKIARSFLVAFTLFLCCFVVAVLGTTGIFLSGKFLDLMSAPTAVTGAAIILVGAIGDTLCLRAVLAIKRIA